MQLIDRRRVSDAFGKQARFYDSNAAVQKLVIARFSELLKDQGKAPRRLLDVGAGTGMLLRILREMYKDTVAVGIDLAMGMSLTASEKLRADGGTHFLTADAEHLPFAAESFDMVLSTSTFQWLTNLDMAFGEALRVLAPGGFFNFTLFGERTLHELRSSFRLALKAAGCPDEERTHTFSSVADVNAALERSGFTNCRVISEQELETHDDVTALLRSLKRIGAGNASPVTARGLAGKRVMQEMMERYRENYGRESGIPATYEVIYGMAQKTV